MKLEIFKSDSYKKILKVLLKFRYPDLDYEEALLREVRQFGCLVSVDLSKHGYYMATKNPLQVVSYSKYEFFCIEPVYSKLISVFDIQAKKIASDIEVLGRPITICEIVDMLYEYKDLHTPAYCNAILCYYNSMDTFEEDKYEEILLKPKAYYLHEQSQEVIDKIAELIIY